MARKLTTEDFIKKAKSIHGNKYDYSKVEYKSLYELISIKCGKCNSWFTETPANHLKRKNGCTVCSGKNKQWLLYDEAKKYLKDLKINGQKDWSVYCHSGNKPFDIPSDPRGVYKEEWSGWSDFLSSGNVARQNLEYTSIAEAKKYMLENNIRSEKQWIKHCKENRKPNDIPRDLRAVYSKKGVWISFPDFFNTNNVHVKDVVSYEEAKTILKSLKLFGKDAFIDYCKLENFDNRLPKNPSTKYKNNGWISWGDFLSTGNIATHELNYLPYDETKELVCNLHIKSLDEFKNYSNSDDRNNNVPKDPYTVYQNKGWLSWGDFLGYDIGSVGNFSPKKKLALINDLQYSDLLTMDPIELSIIIGQGNLPVSFKPLIHSDANSEERITTLQELRDRLNEETSETSDEQFELSISDNTTQIDQDEEEFVPADDIDVGITTLEATEEPKLPSVNSIDSLRSLDNSLYATMDEEAFETLIQYKLRKLWNNVLNEEISVEDFRSEEGGRYFTVIQDLFFEEYNQVSSYVPPAPYSFPHAPNLMQKLAVHRLVKNKYYGNWSGTGAGKTLSFIIASREVDAKLTLVIALNSTIKQTCKAIKSVYADSITHTVYSKDMIFDRSKHNYLVLNYEKFQQQESEELFQNLTNNNKIDFVVVDEVHNAKQRKAGEENESIRRAVMNRLLGRARENNSELYSIVMSATPVINELYEAKSLLSLMSGLEFEDLKTRRSLSNALKIFQQLILNGLRFIPKYNINITELSGQNMTNLNIDGNHLYDQIISLPPQEYVEVEKILLEDKLAAIRPYLRKGVVVYSHFTSDITDRIKEFVKESGFSCGTYTGDESPYFREINLENFIKGDIDILIGSDPIGTGVDGLQEVCNRMIVITLPWTDSAYTQLKGRIYRQGSIFDNVEIIIPQVKISLGEGECWSWDIQRLNLIKNKKTLADAAVDGIIPSRIMPTPGTMFKKAQESLIRWQDRINAGNIITTERNLFNINLYPDISDENQRQNRINSELSEFNRRGKTLHSETMHKEFAGSPDSWFRYHALRNDRMKDWNEIPYEYIATKIRNKNHKVADFGCGENKFKNCVPHNQVISFDHVACDDSVIACDMRDVSQYLTDESIDVAVFSLALWGTNYKDYIKEAYRALSFGGQIHIAEPAKNYETAESEQELVTLISEAGFKVVGSVERRDKFIYITGIKI